MASGTLRWACGNQQIRLGFDRLGDGPLILLLPALSSISTRREMLPLQERLARRFATIAIDWPGFGDQPRPPIAWTPPIYSEFLRYVLTEIAPQPLQLRPLVMRWRTRSRPLPSHRTRPARSVSLLRPGAARYQR